MPPRKKKEEEMEDEELDEPEEPEEELPVRPLAPRKTTPVATEEDEIAKLQRQIDEKKAERDKKTFLQTAQVRIKELEDAVRENREYLAQQNSVIQELQENFNQWVKKKK